VNVSGSVLASRHSSFTKAAAAALCGLLALGSPSIAVGASTADVAQEAAALSVTSVPAGATVYVDGQLQGATPLDLKGLAPGDHRVSVMMPGYLENSRVVSLRAGQSHDVQVKLTPQVPPAGEKPQVPPAGEKLPRGRAQARPEKEHKGGGSTKWVLLGLGVAGAGAAAYYVVTKNDPPVPGTISVSPSGTGMAGATSFTFTSNATDPDNDTLTYDWNFGDGNTGSGQSATHVYTSAGTFNVGLSVKDKKETVTAPNVSVTVARNMAGSWTGGRECGFNADVSLNLAQSGNNLGGNAVFSGNLQGTISLTGTIGTAAYPTSVSWATPNFTVGDLAGSFNEAFSGTVDASGNTMTGTITATSTALQPPTVSCPTTFRR
jgi:PEGA domain-containing protein/PKD domain-containing protein